MAGGKKGATSNINNRTGNTLPTVPEEDPLVGQEEGGSGSPPSLGNNGLEALWAKIQELEKGRVEQDRLMAELMEENERLRGAHPSKRAKSAHERVVVDDSADNREDEGEGSKSNRPHELTAENGRGGSVLKGFNTLTPAELAIEASLNVRRSPFSSRIMSMTRPRKFRAPKFILYDGSSDPLDHIYHFQQKMDADQYDEDYLLCRTFASSLGSEAMSWFRALPEGSVDSFRELCRLFVSQYVCNVRKKDVNELFALRQYQGERMKDFVKRFSALHGQVEGCDTKVAALAFRAGLLKGSKLEMSLYKKPPTDLTEVMARADAVK